MKTKFRRWKRPASIKFESSFIDNRDILSVIPAAKDSHNNRNAISRLQLSDFKREVTKYSTAVPDIISLSDSSTTPFFFSHTQELTNRFDIDPVNEEDNIPTFMQEYRIDNSHRTNVEIVASSTLDDKIKKEEEEDSPMKSNHPLPLMIWRKSLVPTLISPPKAPARSSPTKPIGTA